MSFRMSSLWIVGALLVASTLKADPPQGEPAEIANQVKDQPVTPRPIPVGSADKRQVQFNVKIWRVDYEKLRFLTKSEASAIEFFKANGLIKPDSQRLVPVDESLPPPRPATEKLAEPAPAPKKSAELSPPPKPYPTKLLPITIPRTSFAVRREPVSMRLLGEDITSACKLVGEPTLVALANHEATLQLSGKGIALPVPSSAESSGTSWRHSGMTLQLCARLFDNDRLTLTVDSTHNEPDDLPEPVDNDSTVRSIESLGLHLAAPMKLGEWLLLGQFADGESVALVQIQPVLASQPPASPDVQESAAPKATPNRVAKDVSAKDNHDGTFTVEDRWPIADTQVGERVLLAPVIVERTSLLARSELLTAMQLELSEESIVFPWEVVKVEANGRDVKGRRITIGYHRFDDHKKELPEFEKELGAEFFEMLPRATTYCVLPASESQLLDHRWLHKLYNELPPEIRPVPQEIFVGESFLVENVLDPVVTQGDGASTPLVVTLDSETEDSLLCRVTAKRPGLARLVHADLSKDKETASFRRTDYLVKADTRELELHLKRHYPTSNVTITSLGMNSLMLQGTAASEEDSRGIVELAEQFAPKVLNRLKVGTGARAAAESSAVRQANGVADDANSKSTGERGGVSPPVERDRANDRGANAAPLAKSQAAEPQRVRPLKAGRGNSPKSEQLQQLRDEIRELRQEVRELMQRMDREQAATPQQNEDVKPANAETHRRLIGDSVSKLLKRACEASEASTAGKVSDAKKRLCFIGVANGTDNEVGELKDEIYELIDAKIGESQAYQSVSRRYVEAALKQLRLRPDDLLIKENQRNFVTVMQKMEQPFDELLVATLTSDETAKSHELQHDDVLTLELLNIHGGGPLKESAKLRDSESTLESGRPSVNAAAGSGDPRRAQAAEKLDAKVVWEMVDLPLSKAVQHLADDVGINIVLDKRGLEEAGVDPETRISRTLKGVKLRSALKIVLEPLKLGYLFDGEVLKITSQQRAAGPPIVVAYPVADLLNEANTNGDSLTSLLELIAINVPPESQWFNPPKISKNEATKTLFVRQPWAIQDQVQDFLDLLRQTARETKAGRATGFPKLTAEELRIQKQLGKTVTLELKQPIPLQKAVEQVAQLGDFNLVLDQAGLADAGLKSSTPVSIQVRDVRLSTALRLLLEPLNLDFVIKYDVLQITSRQRAAGQLTIATYPIPNMTWQKDAEGKDDVSSSLSDLCDLLMTMIEPESWEIAGGPGTVRKNVTTQSLVVRQTQANHARIRELLETLRKAGNQTTSTTPRQTRRAQSLATKVSVLFENVPLSKVIEHLSEVAKVRIVLDLDGLKDEALTPQTPVSLAVDQIALRSVLSLLLEPLNLDFTQDADGLKVSSAQRIQGLSSQ